MKTIEYKTIDKEGWPAHEQFIRLWCIDNSYVQGRDNRFVRLLRSRLGPEEIVHVLKTVDDCCRHCYDEDSECRCFDDS